MLLALVSIVAFAAPVSRSDARRAAQDFLAEKGISMKAEASPFRAPRKGKAAEDAYYYVFNVGDSNGFVIVSGDDRTEQVLGYCDHGDFNADSIPEHMRSWLQTYANDIQWLEDHNVQQTQIDVQAHRLRRKSRKVYHSVSPLLRSWWNQSWPYNCRCPHYVNSDGTEGTPPAGCVAVAMAQIMYYYRYPEAVTGSLAAITKSYTYTGGSRTITTGSVSEGTKIDWDHMKGSYGSYTDEEAEAVGNLMLYCGLAVRMSYSKGGSGAVFSKMASGLRNNFGYDSGVYVASRGNYTIDGWFDLVYDELASGHPVGFCGNAGGSSGHAFVLDGFDGEGLFHVNWGWGGMSDGWYVLSILKPGDQTGDGDSSTTGGYSMSQGALIGVRVPGTVERKTDVALSVTDISCNGTSITATYKNESGYTANYNVGIVVYDESNDTYELIARTSQTIPSLKDEDSKSVTINLSGRLTQGVYKISPASKLVAADEWHAQYDFKNRYILATVGATRMPVLEIKNPQTALEIDSISFPTGCVVGNQQEVRVRIRNVGDEFYGKVELFGGYDGEKTSLGSRAAINVRKGETITMSYYFTPEKVGTLTLYLCDAGGGKTYAQKEVEIIAEANAAHLSLTGITYDNSLSGTIYTNRVQGTYKIRNLGSHDFNGKIKVQRWIQKSAGSSTYVSSSSNTYELSVAAGATTNVPFCITNLSYGINYQFVFYYVGQGGTLDNGALWKNYFKMQPGVIYWTTDGKMTPLASSSSLSAPTAACGMLCSNINLNSIRPNRNPNTLYYVTGSTTRPGGLSNNNLIFGGSAEKISLTDGNAYYVPESFSAETATFSHTFPETTDGTAWETFLMPFAATRATVDGTEYLLADETAPFCVYEFTRLDDGYMPAFTPVATMQGNTPYIIAASREMAGKTVVFHGEDVRFLAPGSVNFVLSSETFNQYGVTFRNTVKDVYTINAEGTAFNYVASQKLEPLQTYFVTKLDAEKRPAEIPLPAVPERLANGISLPFVSPSPAAIYDLSGRRVEKAAKGVYIVNGKKVLY